jgi:hypothetical protein
MFGVWSLEFGVEKLKDRNEFQTPNFSPQTSKRAICKSKGKQVGFRRKFKNLAI